jgi:hypothetical protein
VLGPWVNRPWLNAAAAVGLVVVKIVELAGAH